MKSAFVKPDGPSDARIRAFFLAPPRVHLLDLSGPVHIFYEAREYGAPLDLHFLGLDKSSAVESSAGLVFTALEDFSKYTLGASDWIFIPGLDQELLLSPEFIQNNRPFLDWLSQQHHNGARICSVCTGAFLLAQSGLLNGRRGATHWKYLARFQQLFPHIKVEQKRLFVVDDRIYTSAGVASGIDLALFLLEESFGSLFAADIAREVVIYLRRGASDPQLSIFLQYRNHLDDRIHRVQDMLSRSLQQKVTIEDLAKEVSMSPRNLTRLFKKTLQITIGQYLEKLRVERALQLLAEDHKVEYTARACGLKSTNQLRALLKKYQSGQG